MADYTNLELLRKMKDALAVLQGECRKRGGSASEYAAIADMGLSLMGLYDAQIQAWDMTQVGETPVALPSWKILVEVSQRLSKVGVSGGRVAAEDVWGLLEMIQNGTPDRQSRDIMLTVAAVAVTAVKNYDDA